MILTLHNGERAQTFLLRQCLMCSAPLVCPAPPDWTFDLIKEGPVSGPVHSFVTPHRPGCTAGRPEPVPGMAMRVPGSVLALEVDELTPFPHRFMPWKAKAPSGTVVSDWCAHGAIQHMFTGRGFCGRRSDHALHHVSDGAGEVLIGPVGAFPDLSEFTPVGTMDEDGMRG